jgi:dTDP-4-amino-4,6-dideoxygalactose transaminase
MSSPDLTADDIAAVNAVLHTPVLSIGPQIDAFEQAAAATVGAHYGIGVNSGTAGLHLGVIAAVAFFALIEFVLVPVADKLREMRWARIDRKNRRIIESWNVTRDQR